MRLVLTTASVPDPHKVSYWSEVMSRTLVPMTVTSLSEGPFEGRIVTGRLGYLQVATVEADAERVSRTPSLVAKSPDPLVAVAVQVSGTAVLVQGDRRVEVSEGELVVYNTAHPYSIHYPRRFATHVFQLPRRALGVSDDELGQATGQAIGREYGLGAILLPFLARLASSSADDYQPAVADRLAGSVVELLATLIAERAHQQGRDDDGRGHLMMRILSHINRNLGDPDLSPELIAQAHQISVRYLHRLFEGEGTTVSRLIRQRRLEECGRELARRGRTSPTVSAVAQRWGFLNPAHFSRAFRAHYGVSPREWRILRTTAGLPPATSSAMGTASSGAEGTPEGPRYGAGLAAAGQ
ncbi:AraC-like ligand-binding domain-containing protein [Streptomyces filamentosus]|uniref:AraC-like ligand-binding domain-containing protein n=1 Tax=Streptomyces filamentosus TaxID=67294 RepID=UPI0037D80FE8